MMQAFAREALASRTLIRLPFEGGPMSRLRTVAAPPRAAPEAKSADRIADRVWEERGAGLFDGRLLGIADVRVSEARATLACEAIRYRDYLAADALLRELPDAPVPLAVGVHALLCNSGRALCLRLANGRLALPGGAADAEDFEQAPGRALERALSREVREEIGLELQAGSLEVTGIYIGGYPTHLLVLATAELGDLNLREARRAARADRYESLAGADLVSLAELRAQIDSLPLVVRAALQSLFHRRGEGSFETIPT